MFECADRLGLDVVACVHDSDDGALVKEYMQTMTVHSRNEPAEKWSNALMTAYFSDNNYTHFLLMGDDDSLSNEGLFLLMDEADKGTDYCGFRKNGFVDVKDRKYATHEYTFRCDKLIGAGRLISRKALHATMFFSEISMTRDFGQWRQGSTQIIRQDVAEYICGYHYGKMLRSTIYVPMWDVNRRNGLDDYSEKKLVAAGFVPKAVDNDKIHITDFKVERNIWNFDILKGLKQSTELECTWFLSEFELNYIKSLIGA